MFERATSVNYFDLTKRAFLPNGTGSLVKFSLQMLAKTRQHSTDFIESLGERDIIVFT